MWLHKGVPSDRCAATQSDDVGPSPRHVLVSPGGLVGCFTGGIYACNNYDVCFAPSDPGSAPVGVSTAPGGGLLVVLPQSTAPTVTEIEAFGPGYDPEDGVDPPPVWKIERTAPTPDWDGTVAVGEVPVGWHVVAPLSVPRDEVHGVEPSNGCYGGSISVPAQLPPPGTVAMDGDTTTIGDFEANWGEPILACPGRGQCPRRCGGPSARSSRDWHCSSRRQSLAHVSAPASRDH